MRIAHVASVVSLCCLLFAITGCAAPQPRSVPTILAEIDAFVFPEFDWDREDDEAYVAEHEAEQMRVYEQRNVLILELYETDPEHERVADLMVLRWITPRDNPERLAQTVRELDMLVARHGPESALGRNARYTAAAIAMGKACWDDGDPNEALTAIEHFIAEVPGDDRAATLLFQLTRVYEEGSQDQLRLLQRVRDDYWNSDNERAANVARYSDGKLRQLEAIGKPFEFEFTCAVTGSQIEAAALRGKVVVIDFWATWCGPCVAKMPKFKETYARHRGRGVEFIGISLDQPAEQGGLDRLRNFVEENELAWPQWHLGNGWQSEFSMEWGISGIPTLFILDAEGLLRSTTARGQLEELIEQLLEERDKRVEVYGFQVGTMSWLATYVQPTL